MTVETILIYITINFNVLKITIKASLQLLNYCVHATKLLIYDLTLHIENCLSNLH